MTDRCGNCGRDHTGPMCWIEAAAQHFDRPQPPKPRKGA